MRRRRPTNPIHKPFGGGARRDKPLVVAVSERRRRFGLTVNFTLQTDVDYEAALRELLRLQDKPLGTRPTERLQDLVDAILNYEERHRPNGRLH